MPPKETTHLPANKEQKCPIFIVTAQKVLPLLHDVFIRYKPAHHRPLPRTYY